MSIIVLPADDPKKMLGCYVYDEPWSNSKSEYK